MSKGLNKRRKPVLLQRWGFYLPVSLPVSSSPCPDGETEAGERETAA